MAKEKQPVDWYPSTQQLGSPEELERTFRETLRQMYGMRDQVGELHKKVNAPASAQPTNTASITRILGLPIQPSDTSQLADGTKLTWVAAERVFRFL